MAATSYSADPTLFLYTSLTAGSSHIITATSRLETILKANKIPFRALDCATDEKARMLWGRRSKGRKLPGLVKYGEIIGVCAGASHRSTLADFDLVSFQDLDQIEEWNEYGELKDQIAATQDFGTFSPGPAASTLSPDVAATSTASTPQRSGPPSRASSEGRHISIAEPAEREKEKGDGKSTSQKTTESPMNNAIRQLGAEAAAKAVQKKAGTIASPSKAVAASIDDSDVPDQTPSPTASKFSTEAALESVGTAAEVTAAKTPNQLASEGAERTSTGKIADSEEKLASESTEPDSEHSREEQLLQMRRTSSVTVAKSRLSEATPISESHTVNTESDEGEKGTPPSSMSAPDSEMGSTRLDRPRQHRGSDVREADIEEIRALEKRSMIPEEDEDDEDHTPAKSVTKASAVATTDEAEKEATKGTDTQKTDPKDADQAGVSVGD